MADRMSAGRQFAIAAHVERREVRLSSAQVLALDGVIVGVDESRAAQLGALAELPSLAEVLSAWAQRRLDDKCEDYPTDFRELLMRPNGELSPFVSTEYRPVIARENPDALPMTYRTFGNLLRHYCRPPRNVARCLVGLPTNADGPNHTGRTARSLVDDDILDEEYDSPRAVAYNAYLDRKKSDDQRVTTITGEPATTVVVRTRLLPAGEQVDGEATQPMRRTIIGAVTPTHCLRNGDDDKLIAALSLAFAGNMETARATAFRGVEESEMRALFPALQVEVPGTGAEKWTGYVTARNSESGAKSWAVSAGLYRSADGASVACEAVVRTGRHVGKKVAERMVEVATGAAELLNDLTERAAELSGRVWVGTTEAFFRKLRQALAGTVAYDPDVCCGIALELGRLDGPITIGRLMDVLGRIAGGCERRVDARPIEVLLGRLLVEGWTELKAVAVDAEDGAEEE